MDKLEQLKTISRLENQLMDALKELAILKASISTDKPKVSSPNIKNIKMTDLYEAIGQKKISYVYRIKDYCKENNIKTFEQFISVTPSEFVCTKGIGSCTLRVVNKALEKLGIIWKDVK